MKDNSTSEPSTKIGDGAKAAAWNQAYTSNIHLARWDHALPSPELVGFMLASVNYDRMRVLEIGCGSGCDSVYLAQCGCDVHALDISEAAIEIASGNAKSRGVEIKFYCRDILQSELESASYDLISDRGCFHHIYGSERQLYGKEIARLLKPSGRLFLRGAALSYKEYRFSPLTKAAVRYSFDEGQFVMEKFSNSWYSTDAGGMPGACVLLRRR